MNKVNFKKINKKITSIRGRKYKIVKNNDEYISFRRLDAKDKKKEYKIKTDSLKEIIKDFNGEEVFPSKIKKYVNGKQSPAIAILIHTGYINRKTQILSHDS